MVSLGVYTQEAEPGPVFRAEGSVSRGRGEEQGLAGECRNHDPDVAINNNSRPRYFYGWEGQWVTRRRPALSPWIHPSLPSRVCLHERLNVPATVLGAGGVVLNTTYPVPAFTEPAG